MANVSINHDAVNHNRGTVHGALYHERFGAAEQDEARCGPPQSQHECEYGQLLLSHLPLRFDRKHASLELGLGVFLLLARD